MNQSNPLPEINVSPTLMSFLSENRIGIIHTQWNAHITTMMRDEAVKYLLNMGMQPENIIEFEVPGSFELPLAAKWMLNKWQSTGNNVVGVICFGCVIKGDTPHFEYVSQAVTQGCTQVALEFAKPVIFGVLTVNNEYQALVRANGQQANKGKEAAITLLKMLELRGKYLL